MKRTLSILFCILVISPARADMLAPGTQNIPIDYVVQTDRDHPDWLFFVVHGSGGVQKAKFDSKTPILVPGSAAVGNGPVPQPGAKPRTLSYRACLIVAVPTDAAKKYANEKDLFDAIEAGTVPGQIRAKEELRDHDSIKETDPRKRTTKRLILLSIDAKDGIVLETVAIHNESGDSPKPGGKAPAEPGNKWMAEGFAAAGVACLAGLYMLRRARRRRK